MLRVTELIHLISDLFSSQYHSVSLLQIIIIIMMGMLLRLKVNSME